MEPEELSILEKAIQNLRAQKSIQKESKEVELLKSQLRDRDVEIEKLKFEADEKDRQICVLWKKIKEYKAKLQESVSKDEKFKDNRAPLEKDNLRNMEDDIKMKELSVMHRIQQLEENLKHLMKHANCKHLEGQCQEEILGEVSIILEDQTLVKNHVKEAELESTFQTNTENEEYSQNETSPVMVDTTHSLGSNDGSEPSEHSLMLKIVELERNMGEFQKEIQKKDEEILNLKQLFEVQRNEVDQLNLTLSMTEKDNAISAMNKGESENLAEERKIEDNDKSMAIPGLEKMISEADQDWKNCTIFLLTKLNENSAAFKELTYIKDEPNIPVAAAKFGLINLMNVLLVNGLSVNKLFRTRVSSSGYKDFLLLDLAAKYNHIDLFHLLVSCGAIMKKTNVNTLRSVDDIYGRINRKVLKETPDIRLHDKFGKAVFYSAIRNKDIKIVKKLLSDCVSTIEDYDGLYLAIRAGNVEIVKLLIEQSGNTNKICENLELLLYAAISTHNTDTVKLLLSDGRKLEAEMDNEMTTLHFAAKLGYDDIIEVLLENGVNVNTTDSEHKTALHYAADLGNADIIKVLLTNGANVNATDSKHKTALHYAINSEKADIVERADIVKILLENGANINATDSEHNTALHYAALSGNGSIISCLLHTAGCDKYIENNSGKSSYDYLKCSRLSYCYNY